MIQIQEFSIRWPKEGFSVQRTIDLDYKTGGKTQRKYPAWFEDAPIPDEIDQFFLDAFDELSTERQIGMTLGPIPASAIRDFANRAKLDKEMEGILWRIIRQLDSWFLDFSHKQVEKKNKAVKKLPPPSKKR